MPDRKPFAKVGDIKTLLINVPPKGKQNQIVQQIETLLSGSEQVQALLQKNRDLMDQLLKSVLRDVFTTDRKLKWMPGRLSDVVTMHNDQEDLLQPQYQTYPFIEAEDIDTTIAHIQIDPGQAESMLPASAHGTILGNRRDSLVYAGNKTADGTWTRQIAMPYYKLESPPDGLRCKNDLSVLTVKDPRKLHPRFLFWALQDPDVAILATGKKQQGHLKDLALYIPADPHEQEDISAYLDTCQEQLIQMKESHQASQFAVDQMEGSILDQIFREE